MSHCSRGVGGRLLSVPSRVFELQHLRSKGRDLHGRDSDTIRTQRARALEWAEHLRSIHDGIEAAVRRLEA